MKSSSTFVLLVALPTAMAHGYLTQPAARQVLTCQGLAINGDGDFDPTAIKFGNMMNMNGAQGAFTGLCSGKTECGTDWQTNVNNDQCKQCLDKAAADTKVISNDAGETLNPVPRLGIGGDTYHRNAFSFNSSSRNGDWVAQATQALTDKGLSEKNAKCNSAPDGYNAFCRNTTGQTSIEVKMQITAHHFGWSEFRLCRNMAGKNNYSDAQACFNADVLTFNGEDAKKRYPAFTMGSKGSRASTPAGNPPTDPTDYAALSPSVRCQGPDRCPSDRGDTYNPMQQFLKATYPTLWSPNGSCCASGGDCGGFDDTDGSQKKLTRWVFPSPEYASSASVSKTCKVKGATCMSGTYTVVVKLPVDLKPTECTKDAPCTLSWLFMTGNSPDAYPEAFRNLADFYLDENGHRTQPLTPPKPPSGKCECNASGDAACPHCTQADTEGKCHCAPFGKFDGNICTWKPN